MLKSWKTLIKQTIISVIFSVIISAFIWIVFHGIPLIGLPDIENVKSITITCNEIQEKNITDKDDIELLVNAANLLNYRLYGETQGEPIISVTYHLQNGKDITIQANYTTMW